MPIQNIFFFGNYLTFFTYFVTIKIHMKYSKVLCYLLGEKIGSLFYKIMFAKNYHLYWIAGRTNILSKYIIDVFQFWAWLSRFLSYVISKSSSFLFQTNFELIFAALYCYMYESSKIRSQIFKNLFKLEILISLPFLVYIWDII